ncbi:MAG: alpha/beta fold hydrolase [Syntrophobacteraceae bacterium]|nr:alpha/beta fold hydrolase [Syntrophobacteraceae bacterium]
MFELYNKWMKFVFEVTRPVTRPTFATENQIALETDAFRLRQFSEKGDKNPVLILPPQAGHDSGICDFSSTNSLVGTFLKYGMKSVYAIDWKSAEPGRSGETLESLIEHTHRCVSRIGGKVNLVGLCQGGWQAAMYTALYGRRVNSLSLAGSPIDSHAEPGKIKFACDYLPYNFFQSLVLAGGGLYRGEFQLLAFKLMNPYERFFLDYCDLYKNIDDEAFLERHRRFRNWYETVNDLPGGWYLQIVDQLFIKNNLIKGKMTLFNKKIDLKTIDCPLFMIAGSKDDITSPDQVFNAGKYVSTPPERMEKFLVDSGHIGLFMGKDSLSTAWPRVIEKMRTYTGDLEEELQEAI